MISALEYINIKLEKIKILRESQDKNEYNKPILDMLEGIFTNDKKELLKE